MMMTVTMTVMVMVVVMRRGGTVMMLTPGNAVVQHGEDEEDGVEAGKDHQEVVEGVSHAED